MNYGQNYFNSYGYQPMYQPINQPITPNMQPIRPQTQEQRLQGRFVDSIDVVKATEISLDGSINYFPITDGSAIVTKQLQNDGTSKTIIYKPVDEDTKETIKYVTPEELEKELKKIDLSEIDDLREDLYQLRQDIKELKKKKKEN